MNNAAYGFIDYNSRKAYYNGAAGVWWLRSPYTGDAGKVGSVSGAGGGKSYSSIDSDLAARPAANLDASKVLLTSAASGGKSSGALGAGALAEVPAMNSTEWKVTLLDSSRSFSAQAAASATTSMEEGYASWPVSITCTGANTGTAEYISAMLCDADGKVLYYGNIANNSAAYSGNVNIPTGLVAGSYTLKVFSELKSGDKATDYASALQNIALTVTNTTPTVASVTVNPPTASVDKGGTQAFTATVNGTNNPAPTVSWDVTGENSASTTISPDVRLTVGGDETAKTLTVTATSTADTTKSGTATVTVVAVLSEQFTLAPGGTYWFDLSAQGIPGTTNTGNGWGAASVPDATLTWVPFTYAGTVNAYSRANAGLSTEETVTPYAHSLFVAQYNVTHTASWIDLDVAGFIFGNTYNAGGVKYTLRAPSAGSDAGSPAENEWDTILNKSIDIANCDKIFSWGQDSHSVTSNASASYRVLRGYSSNQGWDFTDLSSVGSSRFGFRPVLEVLSADTPLASDSLKPVTLNLNGGSVGGNGTINIIVKNGESFTAPGSTGLTRPAGNTGDDFRWTGSDGNHYAPGFPVPATVTALTAEWDGLIQYQVTKGQNGTWANGSGSGLEFTVNADFSKFANGGSVAVDQAAIASDKYTAEEGSTVITLNASYLKTLSAGRHTLRVDFADGYAETNFTISERAIPNTGDNSRTLLWGSLALLSAGGIAAVGIAQKKRKSHSKRG